VCSSSKIAAACTALTGQIRASKVPLTATSRPQKDGDAAPKGAPPSFIAGSVISARCPGLRHRRRNHHYGRRPHRNRQSRRRSVRPHHRPRLPSQSQIMGESAAAHAQRLIDEGLLFVPHDSVVQWHWCHLVAFTMLPSNRAQVKRNLIVGSAACNGHMANIEAAVKLFIYETRRPVSLEVTATIIANTHLGSRIRYRMLEPRSQTLFTDYFDALTEIRSDYADFENIHAKLMTDFRGNLSSLF